jgi:catechol 2,3-dioxygenase-like lactoylglutathione lyase family enzyme
VARAGTAVVGLAVGYLSPSAQPWAPCQTLTVLRLDLATIVVDDYDEAIAFFVGTLGFNLLEDADLGEGKRWVVVRPDANGAGLLLARAASEDQEASIGCQAGGRVSFFLLTDDLEGQVADWRSRGVRFAEQPRTEPYGKVVVFLDLFGNRWDLIEPARRHRSM